MRRLVDEAGLLDRVTVDSGGTSAEHLGEQPDRRARAETTRRGLHLDHRAWLPTQLTVAGGAGLRVRLQLGRFRAQDFTSST